MWVGLNCSTQMSYLDTFIHLSQRNMFILLVLWSDQSWRINVCLWRIGLENGEDIFKRHRVFHSRKPPSLYHDMNQSFSPLEDSSSKESVRTSLMKKQTVKSLLDPQFYILSYPPSLCCVHILTSEFEEATNQPRTSLWMTHSLEEWFIHKTLPLLDLRLTWTQRTPTHMLHG